MDEASAQHVHQAATESAKATGGVYKPKSLNDHEYKTLVRLADLIIPADDVSQGAVAAGSPQFIDLLCSQNAELAAIYTGGIAWMDHRMMKDHGTAWLAAKPEEQTALLDIIAYRKNDNLENGPGIRFFDWARKMVMDGFYTSPIGVKDVGYMGNKGMTTFQVPAAAIDYALKRSGLG
jgi:hypothetical protein